MLRVVCEECRGSFCLQHRHPLDHGCARRGHPGSLAGRSESPLPLPVTVSCGVCLNQAEGPLIPAHVASVLEVQSKVMA